MSDKSNHGLGEFATDLLVEAATTVGKAREVFAKDIKVAWSTLASARILDADGQETDQFALSWTQFVSPKKTVKNDNYLLSSVSLDTFKEVKAIFVEGLSDYEKASLSASAISRKAGSLVSDAKDACMRVQDSALFKDTGGVLSLIELNEDGTFSKRVVKPAKAEADTEEAKTGPETPVASDPVEYTKRVIAIFTGLINTLKAGSGDKPDEQEVATDWAINPVLEDVEKAFKLLQS